MSRRPLALLAVLAAALAFLPARAAKPAASCDWSRYGQNNSLTFSQSSGCTTLNTANAALMLPKWYHHAADSMSASTTVVDGVLYEGTWDGTMFAIDAATGNVLWSYKVDDEHEIGFGRIVSTAAVDTVRIPGAGDVTMVLFGGGGTLYALSAGRQGGKLLAKIDVDPRTPEYRAQQDKAGTHPEVEIESSPLVAHFASGDRIFVGFDVHNNAHVGRAGMLAFAMSRKDGVRTGGAPYQFDLLFKFDPERQVVLHSLTEGSGTGWGCGDVWSSPALQQTGPNDGILVFGTGNCDHPDESVKAGEVGREGIFAIDARTGAMKWQFHPRGAQDVDDDFGASPNILDHGTAVGEGGKDGWYYKLNIKTGKEIWRAHGGQAGHVQTGFAVGGFIGTTAVGLANGKPAIFGAIAISTPLDNTLDDPNGPSLDQSLITDPTRLFSLVAIDELSGKVLWRAPLFAPSYGAVTYANGVVLMADTVTFSLLAFDAGTGVPVAVRPLPGPPSSAPVLVGDSIYVALGTSETDLEFKAFNHQLENLFADSIGESPLSPLSGVIAFRLPL
ncbi:MAG TPA: PQQ-binding-like beta-propeller repeat protein [Actinomycetota bacterium]|nr:PQQ-binding-like beta-propeller repeat protein [Actinomycetota bacterium]